MSNDLDILVEAGYEREAARQALLVYGTAQNVLLGQICNETDVPQAVQHRNHGNADELETLVQTTKLMAWKEVNLTKNRTSDVADFVVADGVGFLKRVVADDDDFPQHEIIQEHALHVDEEAVSSLVAMGFSRDQVVAQLASGKTVDSALETLLLHL